MAPRPARPALRWLQAIAHERLGEIRAAEKTLNEAESLDPSWPLTLVSLARYAGDRGDAERGLALLRRANVPPDDEMVLAEQWLLVERSVHEVVSVRRGRGRGMTMRPSHRRRPRGSRGDRQPAGAGGPAVLRPGRSGGRDHADLRRTGAGGHRRARRTDRPPRRLTRPVRVGRLPVPPVRPAAVAEHGGRIAGDV